MSEKNSSKQDKTEAQIREDRLKAALKANMARRKAQAKARAQPLSAPDRAEKDR